MSEFNDPELEKLLGRAGGAFPDVNIAYEQLQGRVRQARRRRTVVMSGVACSLLFATALVAINRPNGSSPAQIGDRSSLDGTFPDETRGNAVNTTDNNGVRNSDDGPVDSADDSSVANTNRGGGTPVTTAHGGRGTTNPSPTTTSADPITSTFSGDGGSITVRLKDGVLSLVSYSAAAGYEIEIDHNNGDRVEVRFESETHRTRIRVDLNDGSMDPTVEETES